jgi:hypothetical protein
MSSSLLRTKNGLESLKASEKNFTSYDYLKFVTSCVVNIGLRMENKRENVYEGRRRPYFSYNSAPASDVLLGIVLLLLVIFIEYCQICFYSKIPTHALLKLPHTFVLILMYF